MLNCLYQSISDFITLGPYFFLLFLLCGARSTQFRTWIEEEERRVNLPSLEGQQIVEVKLIDSGARISGFKFKLH